MVRSTGDEITDRTGRIYVEDDGFQSLKLYITDVLEGDAGSYTCEAYIEGNKVIKNVNLAIYKDITFERINQEQHPRLYSNTLIECRVSGQPAPEVSWKWRGQRIQLRGRYSQDQNGLRISNVTKADDGRYLCRAEVPSKGRYDERYIDVTVYTPPTMRRPPDGEGIQGHEVSLTCIADADPNAKYDFYKDGNRNRVPSTDRVEVDRDSGNIHFRPLMKDDEGQYECVATNDVGEARGTGYLKVFVRPHIWQLKNATADEGRSATLECLSEGDPDPVMKWGKVKSDTVYGEGKHENGRITVTKVESGKSHLTINNLTPEDISNYTCTSENTAGFSEVNGTIIVNFSPRFHDDHNRMIYNWAGKSRNISCHTQAEPKPTIEWFRFNYQIRNNETFRIYDLDRHSNLQVTVRELDEEWIYGFYTCRARNSMGEGDLEIEMKRAEFPGPPSSVTIKESTPTRLVLSAEPPEKDGGVAIIGYRVEFEQQATYFSLDEPILIENLRPSTEYDFAIRSRNEVGVGQAKVLHHQMEAIRRPFPVEIFSKPEGLYPFEYTINWDIPRTGGITIKEYRFRWREVTVDSGGNVATPLADWSERRVADDEAAPMRYYKLELLHPGTHYQVIISARNDIGWSEPHADFVFKTKKSDDNYVVVPGARPYAGAASALRGPGVVISIVLIFAYIKL